MLKLQAFHMKSRIKTKILIISCLFASLPAYAIPLPQYMIDYFTNIWNSKTTDKQALIQDIREAKEDMTIIHHYFNQAIDHFNRLNDQNRTHYPKSSLEDIRNDINKALNYLESVKLKNISKLTNIQLQKIEKNIKDFLTLINNLEKSEFSIPAIKKNIEKMDKSIRIHNILSYLLTGEIIAWPLIIGYYHYIKGENINLKVSLIMAAIIGPQIIIRQWELDSMQQLNQKMQDAISYEDV